MRKSIFFALLLAAGFAACDSKTPTGPSTVTIEALNPPTTTTTIPPGATTTIAPTTSTTTSVPTPPTTRTFVAFGVVAPNVPSQLTLIAQPLGARTIGAFLDRLPLIGTLADPVEWAITGFYVTPGGGRGQVSGRLIGSLEEGSFSGVMTSESTECTAEREFGGSLDPQFLRWSGGQTLRDCKGSPLGFNSLVMLATNAPAPTTTVVSSSTTTMPLQCSYSLSTNGLSVEAAGGQRTVGLTTGPTCGWTVQNFVDWTTVTPTTGAGSATVSMTIAPNPGAPRSATVVIAGLPVVVNQGVPTTTTTSSSTTTSIPLLADLIPTAPGGNYCRRQFGTLLVDVHNQGNAASATSFTRVFFDGGSSGASSLDRLTPSVPPATTTTLSFDIPPGCFVSNCRILINVDATMLVVESIEGNNSATATCDFDDDSSPFAREGIGK